MKVPLPMCTHRSPTGGAGSGSCPGSAMMVCIPSVRAGFRLLALHGLRCALAFRLSSRTSCFTHLRACRKHSVAICRAPSMCSSGLASIGRDRLIAGSLDCAHSLRSASINIALHGSTNSLQASRESGKNAAPSRRRMYSDWRQAHSPAYADGAAQFSKGTR